MIAALLVGVFVVLALSFRSKVPLAEASLQDGTKLTLLEVSDAEEPYVLRKPFPASNFIRDYTGTLIRGRQTKAENMTGTVCWLHVDTSSSFLMNLQGGELPAWLGHAVIVDQDGWSHLNQHFSVDIFFNHGHENLTARNGLLDGSKSSTHGLANWGATSSAPRKNLETLVGLSFPRLPEQSAMLRIYNPQQELVAEFPIHIPASTRAGSPSPPPVAEKLPITRESQGLAVTLNGLTIQPAPEKLAGYRQFLLKPDFSLSWRGGDAAGWALDSTSKMEFIEPLAVEGRAGQMSVSPFVPAWDMQLTILRNSVSPIPAEQQWKSPELRLPEPGEVTDLSQESILGDINLGDVKIRLLKLLGSGQHEFQLPEFTRPGTFRSTTPAGSMERQDGKWTVKHDVPAILYSWESSKNESFELTFRFEAAGREFHENWNNARGPEQVAVFPLTFLPPEVKSFVLQAIVTQPLVYRFVVDPRQLDLKGMLPTTSFQKLWRLAPAIKVEFAVRLAVYSYGTHPALHELSMTDPEIAALQSEADDFKATFQQVRDEIGKTIVGQGRVVEAALTAMFSGGNVLLEGVPGLGKTELIKAMSQVLDLEFRRIQFTPDLMPADIIGTNMMQSDDKGRYHFEFRKGPIFTQLLLADEINRATPKTQSALLETMQEGTVTTAGVMHTLTQPFFVMATQNPLEQEGTYPLPEAQLDRFLFKVEVPFVSRAELNEIVNRTILRQKVELRKLLDANRIMQLRTVLQKVVVAEPIRDFAVRLVLATHPESEFSPDGVKKFIRWGASPRAAQALIRAARVRALSQGRAHVSFEDIRHFADEVLKHRTLLNYDGQAENVNVGQLIGECVKALPEQAA